MGLRAGEVNPAQKLKNAKQGLFNPSTPRGTGTMKTVLSCIVVVLAVSSAALAEEGGTRPGLAMRSPEEVRQVVKGYVDRADPQYDEEFGLLVVGLRVEERWRERVGPPASERGYHDTFQGSPYYALSLLRVGEKVERARKIFGRVLETQVKIKDHPRYGQFKKIYEANDGDVLDGNTTFFVSFALILAVKEYPDLLGDELVEKIKDALSLIPPKEYERRLSTSYTNANIGVIAINFLICDILGDRERFEVCRKHFDDWYRDNTVRGIPERMSRTYYMVDLVGLGLMISYLDDQDALTRAREMLSVFAQEYLFFEDRTGIPTRRTGAAALARTPTAWVLGAVDIPASEFGGGSWSAVCELALRNAIDPAMFAMPAPRQMRGHFVDDAGYTSYFHKDFTLGSFDRWPPLAVSRQHPSDIPVAFSGATKNFVSFGGYSIDAKGNLQSHPGARRVGTPSRTVLPQLTYLASQHANVCVLLSNIREMACELKEYGWMLRSPRYAGRLYDSNGKRLSGTGTVDAQWVFLATDEYYAGVYPLTHFDPTVKHEDLTKGKYPRVKYGEHPLLYASPTPLRYEFGEEKGLDIFAPNFQADPALDVKGNNMPAGAILVLGSAKETDLDSFRPACLKTTIHDEWYVDGYIIRAGYKDCERRVGIRAPGCELRFAFDYQKDKVVGRWLNGRPITVPSELSTIRFGVLPWVYEQRK